MKKLTAFQKNFILNYFFVNDLHRGWKTIGEKLLEKGECVVAGTKCIWTGNIGNFITTEKNDDYYGCLVYKFDLEMFLSSKLYKHTAESYLKELKEKETEIENRLGCVQSEINEIDDLM